jgi:general secretion pathway protein G
MLMLDAKQCSRSHEGFTLIELVVAVMILGILMTIGGFAYLQFTGIARENTTRTNLRTVKSAIDLFNIQHGRFPVQLPDLLQRPKGDFPGWKPYFDKMPKDGWGREFHYKLTPGKKHAYELYSYGSGGPEGPVEDRISVWDV